MKSRAWTPVGRRHRLASMIEPQTTRFQSFDGVEIAIHRAGHGRPAILLHGVLSSGQQNWFLPHGERVIVPGDHRAAAATPELGEAVARFLTARGRAAI